MLMNFPVSLIGFLVQISRFPIVQVLVDIPTGLVFNESKIIIDFILFIFLHINLRRNDAP